MKKSILALTLLSSLSPLMAQSSQRYRPQPQQPVRDTRQSAISNEVQCLQNSANGMEQVFNDHLRTRRPRPTPAEIELQEALHELNSDVKHFVKDLQSGSEMSHLYRTFHMLEYSMQEAWALASQAGYARSLAQWLSDADGHVASLAQYGFRNPRLEPIQIESQYQGSSRGSQNDYVFAPPPPAPGTYVDPRSPGSPLPPGGQQRPGEVRIDLGDALRRIFGGSRSGGSSR
jgi:hypothetical protein